MPMLTSTWPGPSAATASTTGAHQTRARPPPRRGLPPAVRRGRPRAPTSSFRPSSAGDDCATRKPIRRRGDDDQRKRQREEENADEGQRRQCQAADGVLSARLPMRISASTTITSTAALMPNSAPSTTANAAPERVEQAQAQHHQRAGQHEQDAGREPAAHAVQQPADIGRELLRLRPRQQHAEVERVQEPRLVDPLLLVDQRRDASSRSGRPARRTTGSRS